MQETQAQIFHFADFLFIAETGDLTQNGLRIRINKQTAEVLTILLRNQGSLVTRDELREVLWPKGAIVDFDKAINNSISRLRYIFKDDPTNSRFIERVPKRGYRFLLPVKISPSPSLALSHQPDVQLLGLSSVATVVQAKDARSATASGPEQLRLIPSSEETRDQYRSLTGTPRRNLSRWLLVAAIFLLATIGVTVYLHAHFRSAKEPANIQTNIVSLGVAPFEFFPPEDADIATSFRLELEDSLSQLPAVDVMAEHSLDHLTLQGPNLAKEAAKLQLQYVLFGKVTGGHAGQLSLQLELVRARDGTHIASIRESGTIAELPSIRDRLQREIFELLQAKSSERLPWTKETLDTAAYTAYLRGRFYYTLESAAGLESARQYFEEAARHDPQFAKALAALARVYFLMGLHQQMDSDIAFDKAMRLDLRAIEIQPELAEGHAVKALLLFFHSRKLTEAIAEAQRSVQLDRNDAAMHQGLSLLFAIRGQQREARAEMDEALRLDPYWTPLYVTDVYVANVARDYPRMLEASNTLLELSNHSDMAKSGLANALWQSGRHEQAIQTWREMAESEHDPVRLALENKGLAAYQAGGPRAYARVRLEGMKDPALRERHYNDFDSAEWNVVAGNYTLALNELTRLADANSSNLLQLIEYSSLDPLRADPRFQRLLAKIGLSR
jgi:DNA-binding winged helix-turn-helix (wHTH) protein/tetratricopeptide (TPR) repeat protein